MKTTLLKLRTPLLLIAGAILILIGAAIVAAPTVFYAANGIEVGANVSLLNELKAPAGFLLAAGLFIGVAAFVNALAQSAMLLATMIYLSYALARFGSMLFDGLPAAGLVQAALIETVIGLACLALFAIDRGRVPVIPARG